MPIKSEKVYSRIVKENLLLDKYAKKEQVDLMFVPVYSKPLFKNKKIPYITTIHDLQALHYPEYFSRHKYLWLKFAWKRCAKTSDKIVAISNFVKKDIAEKLDIPLEKISVIYNPITGLEKIAEFKSIKDKYDITEKSYYYTVSSLFPHKNLKTLLYVIKKLKDESSDVPKKLLISGIGGKSKNEIVNLISKLDIEKEVILTGFISDEERNSLYKSAKIFLFPSIFEGFGMPPIEAMMLGTPVITTKLSTIY
jgi:glycosyltransferase involved in cell wall biosynthesis